MVYNSVTSVRLVPIVVEMATAGTTVDAIADAFNVEPKLVTKNGSKYYLEVDIDTAKRIRNRQFSPKNLSGIYLYSVPRLQAGEMPLLVPGDQYTNVEAMREQATGRHIKGSKMPVIEE